jgi:hypothetical protein
LDDNDPDWQNSQSPSPFDVGDVDHSGDIDLADAVLSLQLVSATSLTSPFFLDTEPSGDFRLGIQDALWILQWMSGLR